VIQQTDSLPAIERPLIYVPNKQYTYSLFTTSFYHVWPGMVQNTNYSLSFIYSPVNRKKGTVKYPLKPSYFT